MNCNINCDKLDTLKTLLAKDSIIQSHLAIVWRRLMIRFHGVQLSIYLIDQWQRRQHSRKEVLTLDREHDCVFFFHFLSPFWLHESNLPSKNIFSCRHFSSAIACYGLPEFPWWNSSISHSVPFRLTCPLIQRVFRSCPFVSIVYFLPSPVSVASIIFFFLTAATWSCRCFFSSWNDRYPIILI